MTENRDEIGRLLPAMIGRICDMLRERCGEDNYMMLTITVYRSPEDGMIKLHVGGEATDAEEQLGQVIGELVAKHLSLRLRKYGVPPLRF